VRPQAFESPIPLSRLDDQIPRAAGQLNEFHNGNAEASL
jgi:hypothetical protein